MTLPATSAEWRARAGSLRFRNQLYIDGAFRDAVGGGCFATVNPANGAVLTEVSRGMAADIDLAVAAARRAFEDGRWSRQTPSARKEVLLKLAGLIRENIAELALLETLDMGKPIGDSSTIDAPGSAHFFQWHAEAIDKLYDEVAPTGGRDLALIRRAPLGVVGAVVPWNFPLDMATWKLAPALAMGNSVVLKPAEQSPLSALFLAELASRAGLPDGVLNVVPGYGAEAGQALGLHPDVDALVFTGSTATGKRFMNYAAQSNMKQVWLETGGKSPNLIFADADLDQAAQMAAFGILFNSGEVCSANSRILIARAVQEEFTEKLIAATAAWPLGDPMDLATRMGPLVEKAHADKVAQYIGIGKAEARLVHGGTRETRDGSDCYIGATIFADVAPTARIAREEVFGPVLAVTPFDSEEEALQIANASEYGLAASVWTRDLSRALSVSDRLHAGTVSVNTVDALSAMTPFGGMKQSGFGRDLSLHSFDKYSALKTIWIKY
ncbi:aldehyde dehydrogenase [Pseudogemmobacter bohemicus]|uniref:aldehyde dehydrogenase n=1 Tax=Pseudogemmobacter bohemicus TaxID=2250708 RepID=UPI000DD33149|nr:aldehyde dehydrogenase [Pseudogemmobacter bohemicus]